MSLDLISSVCASLFILCPLIGVILLAYLTWMALLIACGARDKRLKRMARAARISAAITVLVTGTWFAVNYLWMAELRRSAHACESQVSDFDNGKFLATQCLLDVGYDYLRIYDNQTRQLLADRTYKCSPADVNLIMTKSPDYAVVFDGCAYADSVINLPPSLFDGLRTKFP